MKLDIDDIERKARAATPGNWTATTPPNDADGWSTGAVVAAVAPRQRVYTDHRGGIAVEANRQHIAAASPQVVLALVEIVRAANAFVDEQGKLMGADYALGDAPFASSEFDDLVSAVKRAGR